jgi:hypothetical protein
VSGICHWLAAVHWGRVGTWALAIGTFSLAFFTWRVSRAAIKTLDQNKLLVDETHRLVESNNTLIESEERHHQENLRPICVFELDVKGPEVFSTSFTGIRGFIANKGLGASVEGILYLILPSLMSYLSIKFPTLGHGDRWVETEYYNMMTKCYKKNIFVPLVNCDDSYAGAVQKALNERELIIIIKYKDLFGNWLITEQKMNKANGQFDMTLRDDGAVPVEGFQCVNSPTEV